jgi:hypothetical protein
MAIDRKTELDLRRNLTSAIQGEINKMADAAVAILLALDEVQEHMLRSGMLAEE